MLKKNYVLKLVKNNLVVSGNEINMRSYCSLNKYGPADSNYLKLINWLITFSTVQRNKVVEHLHKEGNGRKFSIMVHGYSQFKLASFRSDF